MSAADRGADQIEPVYKVLGERIRRRRTNLRLTQAALAESSGISRASLANIERGEQRLLVHTLVEIANALRVEPDRLLQRAAAPTNMDIPLEKIPAHARDAVTEMITKAAQRK